MLFILFFGTREVVKDDPEGEPKQTRCPSCGNDVILAPKTGRSYAHIFWIPLIPLGETHYYLRCPTCKATFHRPVRPAAGPSNRRTP